MAYQTLSRLDLRNRLIDMTEGTPFWTADEANRVINQMLRTWNLLTGRFKGREVLNTTPNTFDYAVSSFILYRTRVLHNGKPLSPTSYESLIAAHPGWMAETTVTGGGVPTRPTVWCPISLQTFLIWPADAVAWNSLTVDGVIQTPQLAADGDYVNLPEADISVLLAYALHLLTFKKGGQAFAETGPAYAAFLRYAGEQNTILTTSNFYRLVALTHRDDKPLEDPSVPHGLQVEVSS